MSTLIDIFTRFSNYFSISIINQLLLILLIDISILECSLVYDFLFISIKLYFLYLFIILDFYEFMNKFLQILNIFTQPLRIEQDTTQG